MKTTKIDLAAALISLGAGIVDVDRTNPRQMEFQLANSSPTIDDEDDWFYNKKREWDNKTLVVNVRDFVDAFQTLKSEVHRT